MSFFNSTNNIDTFGALDMDANNGASSFTDFNQTEDSPTKRRRLTRTLTPHPSGTSTAESVQHDLLLDNSAIFPHTSLFQDLNPLPVNRQHNEGEDHYSEEDDEPEKENGRTPTVQPMDISRPPRRTPLFAFLTEPSTLALQSSSTKRVRIDPESPMGTSAGTRRVRFDESKNTVHLHPSSNHFESTLSLSNHTARPPRSNAQPLVSALSRRQPSPTPSQDSSIASLPRFSFSQEGSSSPEKFTLSLENSSQDILDFASSLSRLIGGNSSPEREESPVRAPPSPFSFQRPSASPSPLRSATSFRAAPPSPVRPSFMSYSPPPSSSLSSSWSPSMDDSVEDQFSRAASPEQNIAPVPRETLVARTKQSRLPSRRTSAPANKSRFPALLKREASNASFLDSYPASLAPASPPRLTTPPREPVPELNTSFNIPLLTKSMSDLSSSLRSRSSAPLSGVGSLKRSLSFEERPRQKPHSQAPLQRLGGILATPPDSQLS